jgi:hypothetical protein
MATYLGYQALIVDQDYFASKLGSYLMSPDQNSRMIRGWSFASSLANAFTLADACEFIYIDPFAYGLHESMRFINEVLAHSAVKAFTLFRSSRQWQEHQREIDGLLFAPPNLRTMLYLDKDQMTNEPGAFAQRVRDNVLSMEREYQQARTRWGDPGARSGIWGSSSPNETARSPLPGSEYAVQQPFSGGIMPTSLPYAWELRQMINDAVATAMARQSLTQTTPLLPAPGDSLQWQGVIPQMQQIVTNLQNDLGKLRDQQTAQQRESARTLGNLEQRIQEAESRLNKNDQFHNVVNQRQNTQNTWLLALSLTSGVLFVIAIVLVIVVLQLHR